MHTLRARLLAQGQLQRGILTVATVFALLTGVAFTLNVTLSGVDEVKDIAAIIQSSVTALAIVVGGTFALYKLQVLRTFEPHLTISHEVSHRPIGDSYVHIDVAAILHNGSKVQIELRKAFFLLQQIAPIDDEDIESMYAGVFVDRDHGNLRWPTLDGVDRAWNKGELIVEPGESHPETYEFIVSMDVESVIIYTYFHNPAISRSASAPEGWAATTVHDIIGHRLT